MPAINKGPRLYWKKPRRDTRRRGNWRPGTWVIRDKQRIISTGCAEHEIEQAEQKLATYIASKHIPTRKIRLIEHVQIADVLSVYFDDKKIITKGLGRLRRLAEFWGKMTLDQVTGETCRMYTNHRGNAAGSRRDLEDLRAAINHHRKAGFHREIVTVTLPEKGPAKERWLTRDEIAKLLWVCLTTREIQTRRNTRRRPLHHLTRFILMAYYTGSRSDSVFAASFTQADGNSYVDMKSGVFFRLPKGKKETNKRQPPVPLPARLKQHLRRWRKTDQGHVVKFNGQPVKSVKKAFAHACKLAELEDVTPHTLRHTTATHLMQKRVPMWQAAGFMGMSTEILEKTYGHHHPDYMRDAAAAL